MTKQNTKEVVLGKAQGAVIKCFIPLPADVSWNNVKAVLREQISLVPTVTHAATWLMHGNQQK